MRTLDRHPSWRWAAPVAALALVGGGVALGPRPADAAPNLPAVTAQQLLIDLQKASPTPLSGKVTQTLALGLPELPTSIGGRAANADLTSLVSGTHSWRVWYGGPTKMRLALIGQASESDIVRNGSSVWVWSSGQKTATRYALPAGQHKAPSKEHHHEMTTRHKAPAGSPDMTNPQAVADWALTQMDPSTTVTTSSTSTVAGRAAYDLVLTPKSATNAAPTRVARVALSIDAEKHLPLAVRVYSTQQSDPAIEVAFTSIDFATPADSVFAFTPPPGATVDTKKVGAHSASASTSTQAKHKRHGMNRATTADAPTLVGSGWGSITTGTLPAGTLTSAAQAMPGKPANSPANGPDSASDLLALLPTATGSWGRGHVLDGTLFSAVITTDGRYAVGAVAPAALYAALPAR